MIHYNLDWGQLIGMGMKRNADGLPLVNADGTYVTDEFKHWGSVVPKTTGGLVNSVSWKDLTLNFSVDYQVGGKFFSLSEVWGHYSGLMEATAATNDRGSVPSDELDEFNWCPVLLNECTDTSIRRGIRCDDYLLPLDRFPDVIHLEGNVRAERIWNAFGARRPDYVDLAAGGLDPHPAARRRRICGDLQRLACVCGRGRAAGRRDSIVGASRLTWLPARDCAKLWRIGRGAR